MLKKNPTKPKTQNNLKISAAFKEQASPVLSLLKELLASEIKNLSKLSHSSLLLFQHQQTLIYTNTSNINTAHSTEEQLQSLLLNPHHIALSLPPHLMLYLRF